MPYHISAEGCDSEFEEEDGSSFNPVKLLGSGSADIATLFRRNRDLAVKARMDLDLSFKKGDLVVLKPRKITINREDSEAIRRKLNFFLKRYKAGNLFTDGKTYRLVVPRIPGILYSKIHPSLKQIVYLGIYASQELRKAHAIGLVYIDLKLDNIHCNSTRSYLLDGDLSSPIGEPIPRVVFTVRDEAERRHNIKTYFHIAPECWSLIAPACASTAESTPIPAAAISAEEERALAPPEPAQTALVATKPRAIIPEDTMATPTPIGCAPPVTFIAAPTEPAAAGSMPPTERPMLPLEAVVADVKMDIFSLGNLLRQLLQASPEKSDPRAVLLVNIITDCMKLNPTERPCFDQIEGSLNEFRSTLLETAPTPSASAPPLPQRSSTLFFAGCTLPPPIKPHVTTKSESLFAPCPP